MLDIAIVRTGEIFSFASNEFEVTYPDGHVGKIWSPPWHEMDENEELVAAKQYASKLYMTGKHKEN